MEEKNYKFRDDLFDEKHEGTTVPIELLVDPYTGVVYRYTVVNFKVGEDQIPRMQFDFEIVKPGKFSETTLRRDDYFIKNIGVILNDLLLEANDDGEIETGDNETRTDNNQEPNKE